eukprot:3313950-Lingulodinium_polyedra.AAC.1
MEAVGRRRGLTREIARDPPDLLRRGRRQHLELNVRRPEPHVLQELAPSLRRGGLRFPELRVPPSIV